MNVIERAGTAFRAGLAAWRGIVNQGTVPLKVDLLDLPTYTQRYAYFANSVFSDRNLWRSLYERAGMYHGARPVYNPVRRAVDFYVGKVWPGGSSEDGAALPDGVQASVPLAKDMQPALVAAVGQLLQWSNFQELKDQIVTWGAALGDLLIEIDDDVAGGKVRFTPYWPDDVLYLRQEAGALKEYILEYRARDDDGSIYVYRKEVDKFAIRTYRDGYLHSYNGAPPEYPNPYPFVAARWIRHKHVGADRGVPAAAGTYHKIDHLMSLASHVHDQIHRTVEGAMVIVTPPGTKIQPIAGAVVDPTNPDTWKRDPGEALMLQAPTGTTVLPLIQPLALSEALALIQDLQAEIEADLPVLKVYEQIRSVSSLTGPAIERMVGDAAGPLYAAQAQYDQGLVSLLQMGIAIAGWRYQQRSAPPPEGVAVNGWAADTVQQQRYAGFGLDSYDAGRLNIVLMPRPLLPPTLEDNTTSKQLRYAALKSATDAGLPLGAAMRDLGFTDDQVAAAVAAEATRAAQTQAARQAQLALAQAGQQVEQGV